MSHVQVGKRAPEFSLQAINGDGENLRTVALGHYLDSWLVLLFYPRDFSMV